MSADTTRPHSGPFEQDPRLVDWLVALSHDSPLESSPADATPARNAPPLAAAPSLLSLLKDADPNVRLRTATAVGELAQELRRVLPALRAALEQAALEDGDEGVRAEAVRALLHAGPQPDTEIPALTDALRNEIDVVRFHAAMALGDIGPAARAAVPALIHACTWDDEPAVRVGAAAALWKIDGDRGALVLHVLTEALANANEMICWIAADCLVQMGPAARQAAPALQQALRRSYRLTVVATSVQLALDRIQPKTPA
jgi:HEAT repeat protein